MKIAAIGTGKTGGKVVELLGENELSGAYNSQNMPDENELSKADAVIVFIPDNKTDKLIELLIKAGKPVIWGVTGYRLKEELHIKLVERNIPWIYSANFSLGMNIMRDVLRIVSGGLNILEDPKCSINEIHHTKKLDAPSGTALVWKDLIGGETDVTSERTGDVVGTHQLKVETEFEEISIEHKAKDRKLFAKGAIWSAKQIIKSQKNYKGLVSFEEFTREIIREKL